MRALSRMSWRLGPIVSDAPLSSAQRSAIRTNRRKSTENTEASPFGEPTPFPRIGMHIWMPVLLLPLVVGFLLLVSVARILGSALRWTIIWCSGFLAGGGLAWALNAIFAGSYSLHAVWAAGGFLGLIVLSGFYGMVLEWLFWLSRHENNPYAEAVSLSPAQRAERIDFAKSLHWPTALASVAGGLVFAMALFPIIAETRSAWPSLATWCGLGALGLALKGFLLGLFLGFRRERVVFKASENSLGEFVGWQIAGTDRGWRAALGWGIGYALHQLPTGAIAGLALGGLTRLFLS